jgi:hypothetical protein
MKTLLTLAVASLLLVDSVEAQSRSGRALTIEDYCRIKSIGDGGYIRDSHFSTQGFAVTIGPTSMSSFALSRGVMTDFRRS